MAIAFVNSATANPGSVSSFTITYSPTNGHCLCIAISILTTSVTVSSISDNGSSSYFPRLGTNSGTNVRCELWSTKHNGVAGSPTSITITLSASSQVTAVVAEYSGVVTFGAAIQGSAASTATTLPSGNPEIGASLTNSWMVSASAFDGTPTISASSGNLRASIVGSSSGCAFCDNTVAGQGQLLQAFAAMSTSQNSAGCWMELVNNIVIHQQLSPTAAQGAFADGAVDGAASGNQNIFSAAFELPNKAGNTIVAVFRFKSTSQLITPVPFDTQGNNYTLATGPIQDGASVFQMWVYYAISIKGGANTVGFGTTPSTTGSVGRQVAIVEYPNFTGEVKAASASSLSSLTSPTVSDTTTQSNELLFSVGANSAASETFTAGAGNSLYVNPGFVLATQDSFISSPSSPYSVSMSSDTSGSWVIILVTFVVGDFFSLVGKYKLT